MKKILGAADGTRPPMLPYFDGLLAAPGGSESARPGTAPSSVWIARVGVWEPTVMGWDRCWEIAKGGPEENRPTWGVVQRQGLVERDRGCYHPACSSVSNVGRWAALQGVEANLQGRNGRTQGGDCTFIVLCEIGVIGGPALALSS